MEWAEREVEIACKTEEEKGEGFSYIYMCYQSALQAYKRLIDDNHSGMSWEITRGILARLINNLPLTPIENDPELWKYAFEQEDGTKYYQCKRMSSLFKEIHPDGSIEYDDIDRVYLFDNESQTTWRSVEARKIVNEHFPVLFPYYPVEKPYKVVAGEYLTDRKNGDYDTIAYMYIVTPDGNKLPVNRYFGETDKGWRELTADEFNNRYAMHTARKRKEEEDEDRNA